MPSSRCNKDNGESAQELNPAPQLAADVAADDEPGAFEGGHDDGNDQRQQQQRQQTAPFVAADDGAPMSVPTDAMPRLPSNPTSTMGHGRSNSGTPDRTRKSGTRMHCKAARDAVLTINLAK